MPTPSSATGITLTVLYDNNPGESGLGTGWGFSCLVEGLEEVILFDTGADGALLLRNMRALGIAPNETDVIVLSHAHADHTGGLAAVLAEAPGARVYLLPTFPEEVKRRIREAGAELVEVDGTMAVCPRALVVGVVENNIPEQALVIEGPQGMVVMTGCAHPGTIEMVRAAQSAEWAGDSLPRCACGGIDLLLGGFHLSEATEAQTEDIAAALRELGVRRVAPCHCTGNRARHVFELAYGPDYVPVGVGVQLTLEPFDGSQSGMR